VDTQTPNPLFALTAPAVPSQHLSYMISNISVLLAEKQMMLARMNGKNFFFYYATQLNTNHIKTSGKKFEMIV
jgi:hypothetical protein